MKNVTVTLDDELYRKSRVAAAEADTSVTALVREFLTEFTRTESKTVAESADYLRSGRVTKIVESMRKRHPNLRTGNLLSRDEIHARQKRDQ